MPQTHRQFSLIDRVIIGLQRRVPQPPEAAASRPAPGSEHPPPPLDERERRHVAGLMRVNHAGEVAAQALYLGQASVARDARIRGHLLQAAQEERDHLTWCEQRLRELGEGPSRLQPLWYGGGFLAGVAAALAGDRWSLGFVEETEKQVVDHLDGHLRQLPPEDERSRAILEQMRADEARHGHEAAAAGGRPLPPLMRGLMRRMARIMTRSAYWV